MKLVIGGHAQGKLNYLLQKEKLNENAVYNGCLPKLSETENETVVINRFHEWMRTQIMEGNSPEEEILFFTDRCKNCIIISDEIGNGIIPLDAFEREYRERTGRILVELAGRARAVERVICGIAQKIK